MTTQQETDPHRMTEETGAADTQEQPQAQPTPAELLAAKAAEAAALKDQLLRALAETENVRRRADREREDTAKYAITNFAREVVTATDNLRRTIEGAKASHADDKAALASLLSGVELTEREFLGTLEKHNIRRIAPLGERFDPNFHQAMFELPDTGKEPGTVVQVVQAGYRIHDRLLRPALVGVAKGPVAKAPDASLDQKA